MYNSSLISPGLFLFSLQIYLLYHLFLVQLLYFVTLFLYTLKICIPMIYAVLKVVLLPN